MAESIPDGIKDDIVELAEKEDADVEKLTERVITKVDRLQAKKNGHIPEAKAWSMAVSSVRGEFMNERSLGGDPVNVVTLGRSRVQRWGEEDRPVVIGHGIVQPEGQRLGLGVFILDTDEGISLQEAFSAFSTPWRTFQANFSVSESRAKSVSQGYVVNVASDTDLSDPEPYEGDDSIETLHEYGDTFVDDVRLDDLVGPNGPNSAALSERETADAGTRAVDFGIDLKRIPQATVVDTYRDDDKGVGIFTLTDDTIVDEAELEGSALVDDNQRTAGLTAWADPTVVEFGAGSVGDFYGVIEENDGRITMDLRATDMFIEEPREDEESPSNQRTESWG